MRFSELNRYRTTSSQWSSRPVQSESESMSGLESRHIKRRDTPGIGMQAPRQLVPARRLALLSSTGSIGKRASCAISQFSERERRKTSCVRRRFSVPLARSENASIPTTSQRGGTVFLNHPSIASVRHNNTIIRAHSSFSPAGSLFTATAAAATTHQVVQVRGFGDAASATAAATSASSFTVWGGSGAAIDALNILGLPHWACFAALAVGVRTALIPVVVYGAQNSHRFGKIVPEVQFLLSIFQQDWLRLKHKGADGSKTSNSNTPKAPLKERWGLLRTNLSTLGGLYKLHGVKPWTIFLSPLLQLPIFWYISVDLRKIVNGLDPALAQNLVEHGLLWVPDLTEPDPYFGLPILAGLLMYLNVETALGKRALSGPATEKADTGVLLKDIFQSVAVFMPCFTSQLAGGVQIYIATSFVFTLVQSAALRNATARSLVGLPAIAIGKDNDSKAAAPYAQQFIQLKQLEQQAKEARGDRPLLGVGVLAAGLECSFAGTARPSTIPGSSGDGTPLPTLEPAPSATAGLDLEDPQTVAALMPPGTPLIHGVTAPLATLRERHQATIAASATTTTTTPTNTHTPQPLPMDPEEAIRKANRGEYPRPTMVLPNKTAKPDAPKIRVDRLRKKAQSSSKRKGKR